MFSMLGNLSIPVTKLRHRIVLLSGAAVFLTLIFVLKSSGRRAFSFISSHRSRPTFPPPLLIDPDAHHPIDDLIREADSSYEDLISAETDTLREAARAYRRRRGRHPPPGFDTWWHYAKKKNATIIEPIFDSLYETMEPFWSIKPALLQDFPRTAPVVISVRNGTIYPRLLVRSIWMVQWADMMRHMPPLPDVDLVLNDGDDPMVMVPYKSMKIHMDVARATRKEHMRLPLSRFRNDFPEQRQMDFNIAKEWSKTGWSTFNENRTFWDVLVETCRPEDPIYAQPELLPKSSVPPVFRTEYTAGSPNGYVANYTIARSPCHNPNLKTLHGFLINNYMTGIYTDLVPIMSVSNIAGSTNGILIPPPTHYMPGSAYAGLDYYIDWEDKKTAAVWRGAATGGNHTIDNWPGFHRHRFVQVMNGTAQSLVEQELKSYSMSSPSVQELQYLQDDYFDNGLHNMGFPLRHLYGIAAQAYGKLGKWISGINDGGFVNMHCSKWEYFLSQGGGPKTCAHTDKYYSVVDYYNYSQIMHYKYLPDVDGHTSSGRFLSFVRSMSLPIKSTIFTEWHDDRLIPWRHFVPMSAEYQEWWGLMQYFIGYNGTEDEISFPGHDDVAERIARQGSDWANIIERRENILIYFYRVILEYARICADERLEMGYVEDLLERPTDEGRRPKNNTRPHS